MCCYWNFEVPILVIEWWIVQGGACGRHFVFLSRISFQHTCTCMCIEFLGSLFLHMSLSFWSFITKEAYNSIDDQTRIRDNGRIFFYELDRITKIILNHKIEKIMSGHIYELDEITEKITFNIVGVAHFRSIRF
jgi:hypothetical protein